MKRTATLLLAILLMTSIFAQPPEKISYQAVIRDSDNNLLTDQVIGMQISILKGSAGGSSVYVETHTPTSNANGLVSIEIGSGTVVSGDFTTIDWAGGPYFIKTETDPSGGLNYTITSTSQLLSVPYAMHAKTAGSIIDTIPETDPIYSSSVASGIGSTDTVHWNTAYNWGDHSAQGYLTQETQVLSISNDTVFLSGAGGSFVKLPFDGNWSSLLGPAPGVDIFPNNAGYLSSESDPVFSASVASGITASDTLYWNNKLDSYTETDPLFSAWDRTTGITITESQITDLNHFTTSDETDPIFSASVAAGINAGDTAYWNNKLDSFTETDPLFTAWDKSSGILITESQISDFGSYIENESDPVFSASVASGITASDTLYWNNKLDSFTETDPLFTAWDKSSGILITESQISDFGSYIENETDPVFSASVAAGINASDTAYWNNKLDSYTETQTLSDVISLDNSANGQIKNLYDPTDPQDAATKAYVDLLKSTVDSLTSTIDSLESIVNALVAANLPVAAFEADQTTITVGDTIYFIDQASNAPTSWHWDFGDGSTSSLQHPFHVYGSAGSFTVSLTANNTFGSDTETKVDYITVSWNYPSGTVHCIPYGADVVDVTNPTTGETWMDRNLGASRQATSSTDILAYGDLYQWGRFSDGHQCRNSDTTLTQSSSDTPGHGDFIIGSSDWRSTQNDNLWQGVNGINNPCPSGYRLPTENELNSERQSWSSNDAAGAYGSPLKLTLAGDRNSYTGLLYFVDYRGGCRSSTVDGSQAYILYFHSSNADLYTNHRANATSVRCIKD